MRHLIVTVLCILILAPLTMVAQNPTLNYFNASPDGTDVIITWEILDEAGVTNFRLWRKIDEEMSYKFLDAITPEGKRAYQFADYTVYKEQPKNVSYKLQVHKDGLIYTFYTNIVHNPTSVQRTWGSIKSMFR